MHQTNHTLSVGRCQQRDPAAEDSQGGGGREPEVGQRVGVCSGVHGSGHSELLQRGGVLLNLHR